MRKRRLYRYSRAQAAGQQQVAAQYPSIQPVVRRQIFNAGVDAGVRMASRQQGRMLAETERHMLARVHEEPFMVVARQSGYDRGVAAGMKQAAVAGGSKSAPGFSYTDVEDARRRGYADGRATTAGAANNGVSRQKMVDDMLEQCRIIAESNPNMAPGVNAVRHRIKKLG